MAVEGPSYDDPWDGRAMLFLIHTWRLECKSFDMHTAFDCPRDGKGHKLLISSRSLSERESWSRLFLSALGPIKSLGIVRANPSTVSDAEYWSSVLIGARIRNSTTGRNSVKEVELESWSQMLMQLSLLNKSVPAFHWLGGGIICNKFCADR
ncbi:unnamed protein product [Trichobilharzia regenti]|nr:unnamed protein product [Trichobilharzia regenti]